MYFGQNVSIGCLLFNCHIWQGNMVRLAISTNLIWLSLWLKRWKFWSDKEKHWRRARRSTPPFHRLLLGPVPQLNPQLTLLITFQEYKQTWPLQLLLIQFSHIQNFKMAKDKVRFNLNCAQNRGEQSLSWCLLISGLSRLQWWFGYQLYLGLVDWEGIWCCLLHGRCRPRGYDTLHFYEKQDFTNERAEDFEAAKAKAMKIGAVACYVEDLKRYANLSIHVGDLNWHCIQRIRWRTLLPCRPMQRHLRERILVGWVMHIYYIRRPKESFEANGVGI